MKLNSIPEGLYCYTTIGHRFLTDGSMKIIIDTCPFYNRLNYKGGHCDYLKCDITDHCKECGENYGRIDDYE